MVKPHILLVYFDLETTGLSPESHEIIEIAAKTSSNETFHTYAKPANGIPPFITRLTGITADQVQSCTGPIDAVGRFVHWLTHLNARHVCLVGHNAASFDMRFIQKAASKLEPCMPVKMSVSDAAVQPEQATPVQSVSLFDTLLYARTTNAREQLSLDNLKQRTIYKALHGGSEPPGVHSAVGDVTALQAIVEKAPGWMAAAVHAAEQCTVEGSTDDERTKHYHAPVAFNSVL